MSRSACSATAGAAVFAAAGGTVGAAGLSCAAAVTANNTQAATAPTRGRRDIRIIIPLLHQRYHQVDPFRRKCRKGDNIEVVAIADSAGPIGPAPRAAARRLGAVLRRIDRAPGSKERAGDRQGADAKGSDY